MKKGLLVTALLLAVLAGGIWYAFSGAGDFIRTQIEQQGSKFLGTPVTVFNVDLSVTEGRLTINDLDVENPEGFSVADAFSLESVVLDLGAMTSEPYVVQTVSVNAPEVLYEVDASGKGNLIVLKDNLSANLPKSDAPPADTGAGPNPLVIVENVTVSNVRLKLDFEKLNTGDLQFDTKSYEITLPTFNAGSIGMPNGLPADQVGAAIVEAMLDNVIEQAKAEAKRRLEEKAKEKLEEEKDKLIEKGKDKLKDLLNR
ncbi:hypothetical protein KJ365_13210 [Glaciecola sp. XM2]|jgi:hypothetical protein|uniref:hypothetical protein n=1 Tax=Glaciecola sp. XM2 TaxID=1914931 RepID=UPI001BDDD1E2|nr:hypothetical protein [Glaciecola sp. XM2]MBT1451845.1 hypothetical protein [Glaciecola sp. XM2]